MNTIKALLPTSVFCAAALVWSHLTPNMPPFGHFRFMNIDIPNSPNVNPCCINNEGLVAGWYEAEKRHGSSTTSGKVSGYSAHGFVWQKGAAQTLDYPGAAATFLNGINNRGVAIGYYDVAIGYYDDANSVHHAVTYSLASSAWTVLPKIRGYPSADGNGINDGGTAMGEADGFPFGHVAWIWHPDSQSYSYFTAPGPSEASTHPSGMSADGKIVGHITTQEQLGDRTYGFLKTMTNIRTSTCRVLSPPFLRASTTAPPSQDGS